jgi:hypothetical protein
VIQQRNYPIQFTHGLQDFPPQFNHSLPETLVLKALKLVRAQTQTLRPWQYIKSVFPTALVDLVPRKSGEQKWGQGYSFFYPSDTVQTP